MKNLVTVLFIFLIGFSFSQNGMEKQMINEINKIRLNPKSFIPIVEDYIKMQEKTLERVYGGKTTVTSTGGRMTTKNTMTNAKSTSGARLIRKRIDAANELINELNELESLDTLTFNEDMYEITTVHGEYLKSVNKIGHYGINGERAYERFKSLNLNVSENVSSVGNSNTTDCIEILLVNFLVDYNIPNRGHRNNLLSKDIKHISVYLKDGVCVQNFGK